MSIHFSNDPERSWRNAENALSSDRPRNQRKPAPTPVKRKGRSRSTRSMHAFSLVPTSLFASLLPQIGSTKY